MRRAVIGTPVRVPHSMSKLVLDEIGADAQHFVKNRPCHRPEAVPAHFILVDSHASHRGENGVVAHRSSVTPRAWKDKASVASEGVQFEQDFHGLAGEWNNVWSIGLGHGVAPLSSVEV